MAVENVTDIRQRHLCYIFNKIVCNVARERDLLVTLLADDVLSRNTIFLINRGKDLIDRYAYGLSAAEKLGDTALRGLHIDRFTGKEAQSGELFDSSLKLTDIRSEVFRKERQNVLVDAYIDLLRFLFDNSDTELKRFGYELE